MTDINNDDGNNNRNGDPTPEGAPTTTTTTTTVSQTDIPPVDVEVATPASMTSPTSAVSFSPTRSSTATSSIVGGGGGGDGDGTSTPQTNTDNRLGKSGTASSQTHVLLSTKRGESDIEQIALDIESQRERRLLISFSERKQFLDICFEVAKREYPTSTRHNKFPKSTLERLRDEFKSRVDSKTSSRFFDRILDFLGCKDLDESMLTLFQAGLDYTEKVGEDEFFFQDFNFYCTRLVSRFTFMRYPQLVVVLWLLLYFFGSAVFFCAIIRNENVCPTDTGFAFGGWMTSIYFAGVTMSTVGYGDVSLYDEDKPGITFIGTIYMLVAIIVGYCVFSTAAEMTFGGLFGWDMYSWLDSRTERNPDKPLHQQIRRLVLLRVGELTVYFLVLNGIGVFIARAFVTRSPLEEEQWNWSTTIYWAVQTTTTIGYGDLAQPFLLRWVNIFFVTFGTAFVGSVFGSLATLRSDINDMRRYYAWKRRDVSKQLIKELQKNDDKLDQFEFVVGSLLLLNKVSSSDITQIMDKFRELAGDKGYIIDDEDNNIEAKGGVDEGQRDDGQSPPAVTLDEIREIPGGRVFMGPKQDQKDRPRYMDLDVVSSRF